MRVRRPRSNTTERTDIYDPAFSTAKLIGGSLRHEMGSADVHREDFIPILDRDSLERASVIRARVIDEQVEASQLRNRAFNRSGNGVNITQIAFQSECAYAERDQMSSCFVGVVFGRAIGDGNACSGASERECDFASNSARASGYEGTLARKYSISGIAQRNALSGFHLETERRCVSPLHECRFMLPENYSADASLARCR